nr:TOBE domain-containing protein [Lutibaculum baratangense]
MGLSCFLAGTIAHIEAGRARVLTAAGDILVEEAGSWRPGDRVTLSIRPEHFHTEPGEDGRQSLGQAVVESVSFLGTHHQAKVRHTEDDGFRATVLLPQTGEPRPGDRIGLWVRPDTPVILGR